MKLLRFLSIFIYFFSFNRCTNKTVEPIIPIANFKYELGKNGEVKFTNTSQNANNYIWEFGDGESSSEINPVHIYKTENNYKIKLKVNSIENIKDEITQEVNVNNFIPEASFEYSLGDNGLIKLKNTSINSKNFTWSFGDGSNSNEVNPVYLYKNNGNYIIQLIASNSFAKDSIVKAIQINNIPTSCGENTMRIIIDNKPFCSIKNYVEFQKIDFINKTINTFLWFSSDGVYDVSKQLYYLQIQSKYLLNSKINIDKIRFGDWTNKTELTNGIGNINIVNEDANKSITGSFTLNIQSSTMTFVIEGQIDKLINQ